MTRATIAGGAFAVLLVLLALAAGRQAREPEPDVAPGAATPPAIPPPAEAPEPLAHQGFLYGRVATDDGAVYEGRLRFGGVEEAFWSDYFNGVKADNPWAAHVPPERLKERRTLEVFGLELGRWQRQIDLRRPFMTRFDDLTRLEADGRDLRATAKSGTVVHLDRFNADDFADGVRVWDASSGVVDLDEWRIRAIELLPNESPGAAPGRLHGTVRTRHGDFTGFVQWNRQACVGSDELSGRTDGGELRLRFDAIRSIARASRNGSRVTLSDGREIVLSGSRDAGEGHRGIVVYDPRYGRVLVSWDAFERVDFDAASGRSGPAYGDFPPGRPLTGTVTTRAGRRLAGRLVYDLDESETTETLDAPVGGLDYTLPFGLVASIALPGSEGAGPGRAEVTLLSGEQLQLELAGDLGEGNAGLLVFVDGRESPEYVPWIDVERIDLDRPAERVLTIGAVFLITLRSSVL